MIVKWRPHMIARQGPKSRNSALVPLNRVWVKRTPPASDFGKMAAKIRLFLPRFRTFVLLVYWRHGLSFLLSEQALCKWFFTLTWRLLRFWSKNNCAQKQLNILGIEDSILDLCLINALCYFLALGVEQKLRPRSWVFFWGTPPSNLQNNDFTSD